MSNGHSDLVSNATHSPTIALIQRSILSCSEALEVADFKRSDDAIADLNFLLNSLDESDAHMALLEIRRFLSSPNSNQMAVDMVALAVPKAVAKLAGASEVCQESAENVMECIVSICSPRDLLSILCEALDSHDEAIAAAFHVAFLLRGLKKVLSCIKRRPVQQLKIALPVIVQALHTATLDSDKEQEDSIAKLFSEALEIAVSIQTICESLSESHTEQKLHAILCLYILQIIALLAKSSLADEIPTCSSLLDNFLHLLLVAQLSGIGLITGSDVKAMIDTAQEEDDDEFVGCFSLVNAGASLAVIWIYISGENFAGAGGEFPPIIHELGSKPTKRWQAISMFRHILSSPEYPWWVKSHAIDLLLSIACVQKPGEYGDEHTYGSSIMISLFACLQAIEKTIIYAPDSNIRKKSFSALKNVLSGLPSSQRFEMLKALITNSNSPSMVAILLDVVKENFFAEFRTKVPKNIEGMLFHGAESSSLFLGSSLGLIEVILKPPQGGPPSLPEQTEPVLSALNLYRFILLTESAGKTNYSGALSEKSLRKAYVEWLLPLRTLVLGIDATNKEDSSDIAYSVLCSLNPIQLVLHRCIELVEDFLKQCK